MISAALEVTVLCPQHTTVLPTTAPYSMLEPGGRRNDGGHRWGPTLETTQGQISSQISHRCYLILVAFVWELTQETIYLPLGCLQGGCGQNLALRDDVEDRDEHGCGGQRPGGGGAPG